MLHPARAIVGDLDAALAHARAITTREGTT
jgi:hypothetical protein